MAPTAAPKKPPRRRNVRRGAAPIVSPRRARSRRGAEASSGRSEGPARDARRVRPADGGSFLTTYFREMAALDVLEPEQEFVAARDIEAVEILLWERILSYPPLVHYLVDRIEAGLDEPMAQLASLRAAADHARRRSTKAQRAALRRAAHEVATLLRACDTDKVLVDAVMRDIDRIEHGMVVHGGTRRVRVCRTSATFRRYVAGVHQAARGAERARNSFVRANLRLVVSIARRFNHGRMPLSDLIQEGNLGLIKAVERYDYRRGFRFSTYASWWIRHAISRALADKGREVRLPVHMIDAYHRVAKATRELTATLGRQPTSQEIADAANISAAKIDKMRTYLVDQSLSLDRPVNDGDGRTLAESLRDPHAEEHSPVDRLTAEAMTRHMKRALDELTPIEADILRKRFGLDDDRERTLKEIGKTYDLSRERIRQLQEQALAKIRRALARHAVM